MGLFDKRSSISRTTLRKKFREDKGILPRGGKRYNYAQRDKMAQESFGVKYGSQISKDDYRKVIKDLEHEKSRSSYTRRRDIKDTIEYLKQMGGDV